MADFAGRPLVSCPEAYSKSLKIFYASHEPKNVTLKYIEEHIVPILTTSEDVDILKDTEDHSREEKPQFFERAIEPEKTTLKSFRAKTEDLPENLKSKADIKFEWFFMTYQEYVEQKKSNDVQFHMVHFIHSIYYVDMDAALKRCYEKEHGPKGVIMAIAKDGDVPPARYGKEFSSQGLILNPGACYSNSDVTDVARKYGWKYVECPGDTTFSEITAIFDGSSVKGNLLLDFLTHWVNFRETVDQENLQKILSFWEKQCIVDDSGKKIINWHTKAVMILKGM